MYILEPQRRRKRGKGQASDKKKKMRRILPSLIERVCSNFKRKTFFGPCYCCTCCHRVLYNKSVHALFKEKFGSICQESTREELILSMISKYSTGRNLDDRLRKQSNLQKILKRNC